MSTQRKAHYLLRLLRLLLVLALAAPVTVLAEAPGDDAAPGAPGVAASDAESTTAPEATNCQGEPGAPCCSGCQERARRVAEGKASATKTGGCPCQRAKAAREAKE